MSTTGNFVLTHALGLWVCRFRWRRRLFVISAPNDEEWAYQQQLYALTSQACNLGKNTPPINCQNSLHQWQSRGLSTSEHLVRE